MDEDLPPFMIPKTYKNGDFRDKTRENETDLNTTDMPRRLKRNLKNSTLDSILIYTGVKFTGIFGIRMKRGQYQWKSCISKQKNNHSSNSVVTVEKGESVSLPCHDCDSLDKVKYEARQWIKLDSFPDKKGLYRVREVLSDMHDDKSENRKVINLDHTLHIKSVKRKDAGSYFCKTVGDTKHFLNRRMTWSELNDWLRKNVSLNHFYHIDVLDLDHESFVDISNLTVGHLQEPEPEVFPFLNILVQTRWAPWSDCNVCDEEGIRRRIGLCVVKKLDFRKQVPDLYLDHILNFAHHGLLCKSEYLRPFVNENWLNRPSIIDMKECYTPCLKQRQKRSDTKPEFFSGRKSKKKVMKKTLQAGEFLVLVCPGSSVRKMATWVNGTKYLPLMKLKKSSNKRITFDFFGNLHFSPVILSDSGEYSCWIKKKMKKRFKITVIPNYQHEIFKFTCYLLIAFGVDFILFIFLASIKLFHRKVQSRKRKRTKKKTSGSESDDGN